MLKKTLLTLSSLLLVSALSNTAFAAPDSYNRHVLLVNNTSKDIVEFYGSNTGTEEWEEDILGVDVLESGEEVEINFDDESGYCKFDFKTVFSDDSEDITEGFNVCDFGTLTLTD